MLFYDKRRTFNVILSNNEAEYTIMYAQYVRKKDWKRRHPVLTVSMSE